MTIMKGIGKGNRIFGGLISSKNNPHCFIDAREPT